MTTVPLLEPIRRRSRLLPSIAATSASRLPRMQRQAAKMCLVPLVALLIFPLSTIGGYGQDMMQTMKSDHWSQSDLLERARHLREQAREKGSASETLEKYPHHFTMLAFRNRSGGGERHEHFADVFFILDGQATLLTGGTIVDPKPVGPGETLGASVQGGASQELKAGDIVHIPAGMPHQMVLAPAATVTYFVIKAEESSASGAL